MVEKVGVGLHPTLPLVMATGEALSQASVGCRASGKHHTLLGAGESIGQSWGCLTLKHLVAARMQHRGVRNEGSGVRGPLMRQLGAYSDQPGAKETGAPVQLSGKGSDGCLGRQRGLLRKS